MGGGRKKRAANGQLGELKQTANAGLLDDLDQFEQYRKDVLKQIRDDLKRGLSADQIRDKYKPLVQARITTMALTSKDEKSALSAAKDIIDREDGRPTERKEITTHFDKMPDEQIQATLETELKDLEFDGLIEIKPQRPN